MPPQQPGRYSHSRNINCRHVNVNIISGSRVRVQWIRADNSSLPREAYESSGTLYIENVQPSAAGEYQCLGVDHSGRVIFLISTYLEVICKLLLVYRFAALFHSFFLFSTSTLCNRSFIFYCIQQRKPCVRY